jgi:HAD superfamily hydrolase (TIGR01509 family)
MIRAVISDLGKVILNFDNRIFFSKMAAYCPCTEEKIREVVHRSSGFIELFDSGKITPQEFYSRVVRTLCARISYTDFFDAYKDVFSFYPPAFDTLRKLKGKYRLILLSNTDVVRFAFIKSKFPEIFIFDGYVLSFEVGSMKPYPEIYRIALRKAGVEAPAEAVFIDDMEENVRAAEALGLTGILYKLDTDLEKELRALGLHW